MQDSVIGGLRRAWRGYFLRKTVNWRKSPQFPAELAERTGSEKPNQS